MVRRTARTSIVTVKDLGGQIKRYENNEGETLAEVVNGTLTLSELGEAYGFTIKNNQLFDMGATYPVT